MKTEDLADVIIAEFTGEEWEMLDSGAQDIPVNDFYRKTLLEMMDPYRFFTGEVNDEEVEALREALEAHLAETQPENPDAHKYIIWASVIRTFLDGYPMHPLKEVQYYTKVNDGVREYFCPRKGSGGECRFCVAKSCDPLYSEWEALTASTAVKYGRSSAFLQKCILEAGFLNSGIIKTEDLHFEEEVRKYCKENVCHHYNSTWACPPAVGTVEECRERVLEFDYLQLFSEAYYLPDASDWDSMKPAVIDFKRDVTRLNSLLDPTKNGMQILSNDSCELCKQCTYPDAPCRNPGKLHHSIEGYGFYISELARQAGIPYYNGKDMITLFGAILYNEQDPA